jgi:hypothetical protein
VRKYALILFWCVLAGVAAAQETNYFCVVCGKGPLFGRIWLSQWGPVCDECNQLQDRCSICGLPIRPGDGSVKTGDGRFICKFDKANAVLDTGEARTLFAEVRHELVGMFGRRFALDYPDVTVNLFDVDYWSELGRPDGLHKYGFASTRRASSGDYTHEVVLLSGRPEDEMAATAAHEYTHLWINENRPAGHVIDGDTTEAICELSAYKLMESRSQPERMQKILDNPYTHGEITNLVALEREKGIGYILDWVKNGMTATLEERATARAEPAEVRDNVSATALPPPPAETLKLSGLLLDGRNRRAIINGLSFAEGETKGVSLQTRTVQVRCREIRRDEVVLEVNGLPGPFALKIGEERFAR